MEHVLRSWNDGATRDAILAFVKKVTDPGDAGFVPAEERIAVFDNDGTLWCERPAIQGVFILQRFAEMAKSDPSLRDVQPWKAAYENESSWVNDAVTKHYNGDDSDFKVLFGALLKAFGNMDVETYLGRAADFFDAARHPAYDVSYRDVTYVPMVELLDYLGANGFTCYIASGGGRDFMRAVTEDIYDIPPERVIGSAPKSEFKADDDGARVIRVEAIDVMDDGPGKPIEIWDRAGRRPIIVGGNANGDLPMLQFAAGQSRPSLCLLVDHDDDAREVAYSSGAETAVAAVKSNGWTLISMRDDWKQVFAFQAT